MHSFGSYIIAGIVGIKVEVVPMVSTSITPSIDLYTQRLLIIREYPTLRQTRKNYKLPMLRILSGWRDVPTFSQPFTWRRLLW